MICRKTFLSALLSVAAALGFHYAASAADLSAPPLADPPKAFDELRFGVSGSVQSGHDHEAGAIPDVQVLFNPFGYNPTADWQDQLLHPRIHLFRAKGSPVLQGGEELALARTMPTFYFRRQNSWIILNE